MLLLCFIILTLVFYLLFEALQHKRNLRRIPIRIHVNGTRGKSSITRLIAAGLRAGGIRTCAKTTGTLPRFIHHEGSEEDIYRASRPNILEQIAVIKRAAREAAHAIVIECMAVQPELQAVSEFKILHATHTIISNVRPDHLEVMGPTETDVALALAGSIPCYGILYSAAQNYFPLFKTIAASRHSILVPIDNENINAIDDVMLANFSYREHKENVAIALRVCEDLGISREVALHGMWNALPDPGAMTLHDITVDHHRLIFANCFAANDPRSTGQLWHELTTRFAHCQRRILIINCRADRHIRSEQLAEACAEWEPADQYIVIGTGAHYFFRYALKKGISKIKLIDACQWDAKTLFDNLIQVDHPSSHTHPVSPSLIVGIGNIAGIGFKVVHYFQQQSHTQGSPWIHSHSP